MNESPMTFCIGCCNNLNYLKLAVHSVRTYSYFKDAPFVVYSENSTDGTNEWLLSEGKEKYNLEVYIENNEIPKGIGGGMNFCASKVKTEFIMFLHADFFVSKNWDLECLNIFEKYNNPIMSSVPEPMWIFSQRFQPNIFKEDSRPGTLVFPYEEFGYKYDDFNEKYFIEYAEQFSELNADIEYNKGEGVSGLIRKDYWDYIGGNDPIFAPAFFEDKDIFLRMQLDGCKFILTTNSVVFHFSSRSDKSNFPDDSLTKSDRAKEYEQRSGQHFFAKWGFWPVHNEHQFDVIPLHVDKNKLQHLIRIT